MGITSQNFLTAPERTFSGTDLPRPTPDAARNTHQGHYKASRKKKQQENENLQKLFLPAGWKVKI